MPRRAKGARLYLQPARLDAKGRIAEAAVWVIRDGSHKRSTGCGAQDIGSAEKALADYIGTKHEVERSPKRRADEIDLADVINIYAQDIVPAHARPKESASRLSKLLDFWGSKKLSDVNGAACRQYATQRSTLAAARRELEDLRAAIRYHRKEGLCREIIEVDLPRKAEARERFLTRSEAAKLIWAAWRYREVQKGHRTDRRSRQHIARFILVGIYTGTRASAICGAAFAAGPGHGYLDLEKGIFYRKAQGARTTKKRQPPVRLPARLLTHLRRWKDKGIAKRFAVEFNGKRIGKINRAFAKVVTDAKLGTDVTPHTLRHTAATWLMQAGADINKAAGFLGMTVETLERVYGHHHPDFQEDVAEAITRRPGAVSVGITVGRPNGHNLTA